ncbi:O-antigen ligase family protein [Aquihabitans sp. G128]|uniref:cytidylyltransferase domain-containing protein n=1 Tax=Aquihabitans sp. G128 TaxID=2849779 RepID=UPI001C250792|nr:O-antigen ligase family protein [Aquihabitans sp. G128]QXC60273.1 O-antigen ligase family protein [Aquihabitans sp. G128]
MDLVPVTGTSATDLRTAGPRAGEVLTFAEHRRKLAIPRWMLLLGLMLAQAALARAMSQSPRLGLVQAAGLLALGGWAVLRRNPLLSLSIIAYLPGAEIVWRQTRAPVPQYTAAYLTMILAVATSFTVVRTIAKPGRTAMFYFALLLPSIVVTVSTVGGGSFRQPVAFALAGPAALTAMVLLLSPMAIQPWFYRRLLWILAIGGVGPLAIALTAINDTIATQGSIEFGSESNFITSGGFGPVQVSSVMGLTVLAAILLFLNEVDLVARIMAAGLAFLATVQSLLTFSRGGMFATAIALGALVIAQSTSRDGRRKVILVVGVAFAVGYYLIVPRLDAFTDGKFKERFEDTSSGRTGLATNDVEIFKSHLAFGVGPGMSRYSRLPYDLCQLRTDKCANEGSSHTEFTRMLSEHGLAGLGSIVVFAALSLQAYRRSGTSRATCVTFLAWGVAQMFYANMRVVAIPIAFAFAFIRVVGPDARPGAPPDELAAGTDPPGRRGPVSVLALIPARGGSVGIPRKNLVLVGGRPLIAWSIDAALAAPAVDRVIVSTDDEEIAATARQLGAEVPFLRPAELAGDLVTDLPVFQHALSWIEASGGDQPSLVVHLRPTSPARPPGLVDQAVAALRADPSATSVRSVSPAPITPWKTYEIDAEGLLRPLLGTLEAERFNEPRQALPPAWVHDGVIDVVRAPVVVAGSMSGARMIAFETPGGGVDIDRPEDLDPAERAIARLHGRQPG